MASLSIESATRAVGSTSFWMTAGLVVLGSLAASMVTDFARDELIDLGFTGSDLAYAVAGSLVTMALLPNGVAVPLAHGMTASGLSGAADDLGLF